MRRAEEATSAAARLTLQRSGGEAYAALEMPQQLSLDCQRYKWRQNQSHVELFVPLPDGLPTRRVSVRLGTSDISIVVDDAPVLVGRLYHEIKAEESTWFIQDGVVEVTMLKRCRRGNYEAGKNNAGGLHGPCRSFRQKGEQIFCMPEHGAAEQPAIYTAAGLLAS